MKKILLSIIFVLSSISYSRLYMPAEYFKENTFKHNDYLVYVSLFCPSCRAELEHIQKIYDKYQNEYNIHVIIDGNNTKEEIEEYINEKGYTYPIVYDVDRTFLLEQLKLEYVPAVYLIEQYEDKLYREQIDILGLDLEFFENKKGIKIQ